MQNKKSATNQRFGGVSKDDRILATQVGQNRGCAECDRAHDAAHQNKVATREATLYLLHERLAGATDTERLAIQREVSKLGPSPATTAPPIFSSHRRLKKHYKDASHAPM